MKFDSFFKCGAEIIATAHDMSWIRKKFIEMRLACVRESIEKVYSPTNRQADEWIDRRRHVSYRFTTTEKCMWVCLGLHLVIFVAVKQNDSPAPSRIFLALASSSRYISLLCKELVQVKLMWQLNRTWVNLFKELFWNLK